MDSGSRRLLFIVLTTGCILLYQFLAARPPGEQYRQVRIAFNHQQEMASLSRAGLAFDHFHYEKLPGGGLFITTVLDSREYRLLQQSGLPFEVLVDDMVLYYQSLPRLSKSERLRIRQESRVKGFEFGSMGGFYTLAEMLAELDSMRLLYPDIISEKQSLGTSNEDRDIWVVKISDNPEIAEAEPQVLYTALHHSREPQGLMVLMYFMYYLLEFYGADAEVTYLVNNREMYFVPVVNPDGYVYNEKTNPGGGGLWRKNRRQNGDGSFGVDLNRNYGFRWGFDDNGSSADPSSEVFRGTAPFSEPESEAIRDLCLAKNFKLALNYHTFSNLLIYPWGYIADFQTPDSSLYEDYASDMTRFNNYLYGTGNQTVGYLVNGDSDDWMYGEQAEKNKILAMTPEVGAPADGFWPREDRIFRLAEENLFPNLYLAWAAGGLAKVSKYRITDDGNQNGYLDPGETAAITFTVKNIGQGDIGQLTYQLASGDPYLTIHTDGESQPISIAAQAEFRTENLSFTVAGNTPTTHQTDLSLDIRIGNVLKQFPIETQIIGTPRLAFFDDGESGTGGWRSMEGTWETTSGSFYSPNHSFTDSPGGDYSANTRNSLTLAVPFDLSRAARAYLEFWSRWEIERDWDFGQVLVSTDGQVWESMRGRYTVPGSGKGVQEILQPGYEGTQRDWVKERIDLSDYRGQAQVVLRFELRSDDQVEADGWYIDDIRLNIYADSSAVDITPSDLFPAGLTLERNYPNPFNPATHIRFNLPHAQRARLAVYNILGQEIRELFNELRASGRYEVQWDGRDRYGREVSSGIYFYQLEAKSGILVHKMLLSR